MQALAVRQQAEHEVVHLIFDLQPLLSRFTGRKQGRGIEHKTPPKSGGIYPSLPLLPVCCFPANRPTFVPLATTCYTDVITSVIVNAVSLNHAALKPCDAHQLAKISLPVSFVPNVSGVAKSGVPHSA